MHKDTIELLKTNDLSLAAALLCMGFDIIGIDKQDSKKQYFYFKRTPEIDSYVDSYWKDELTVKAKSYSLSRRDIINRIFGQK